MAFFVFMHRSDSIYEDVPSVQYQFPKQYYKRAVNAVGDWVIYLEPRGTKTKGYFAIARVQDIIPDPSVDGMFLAIIEKGSYLEFGRSVQFREEGVLLEQGLLNESGKISGRAQSAMREISPADFTRIVELGLADQDMLPRVNAPDLNNPDLNNPDLNNPDLNNTDLTELAETQPVFAEVTPRDRISTLTSRISRDRNFRKIVLRAYDERCAITGIRLINGGGRAEVEAAHIRPVEHDGPDSIGNGLALSGTAHWMFDRGLVGINDNYEILVSRQVNDQEAVWSMVNETRHLITPQEPRFHPHLKYIAWHRKHCFKN